MPAPLKLILLGMFLLLVVAGVLLFIKPTGGGNDSVVVYTSVDSEYALPLFEKFTKETGITVVPRTDGEAVKTTEMANRLMQMRLAPDGDVFWNSELSQTLQLSQNDVLQPYASPQAAKIPPAYKDAQNRWTAFGCRVRVIIFNTNKLKREDVPTTVEGLSDPKFKNRFVMAKPIFGTTLSHMASLALQMGDEKAFAMFKTWRENGVVLAEGNGDVRNRVAEGSFDIGLTDSDDVFSAMDRGKPVDFVIPDQTAEWHGAYMIPNTVALLKYAPHAANAKKFIDFLLRPETEKWLAENAARQVPVRDVGAMPKGLEKVKPAEIDVEKLQSAVNALGQRIYDTLRSDGK